VLGTRIADRVGLGDVSGDDVHNGVEASTADDGTALDVVPLLLAAVAVAEVPTLGGRSHTPTAALPTATGVVK
jgi:hypothetical protein